MPDIENTEPPDLRCVYGSPDGSPPFAIKFICLDGRTYGFPYVHMLNFLFESPIEIYAGGPTERFSFWFATHVVVISGWRLWDLVDLVSKGALLAIRERDAQYYALARGKDPFVCLVSVASVQPDEDDETQK